MNNKNIKKEIILIAEKSNSGKTQTIIKVHNDFVQHYGLQQKQNPTRDFKEFYNDKKLKGNIVGFASQGDTLWHVQENCKFFKKHNCNICITACRSKGLNKKEIIQFANKNNYNISLFHYLAFSPANNTYANDERARMMLDRIKYLI